MANDWKHGYGTGSDKRGGKRSYGKREDSDRKPYGDKKPYGERSYDRRPFDDKKPYGERSYDRKPYGDKKEYGERSYERKPFGDKKPYGERSYDRKPYGDKNEYGERSYDCKPFGDKKPYVGRSYDRRHYGDKKEYGERSYDRKPFGDKKPYGERNYDRKPYGDKKEQVERSYDRKPYVDKKPYDEGFKRKDEKFSFEIDDNVEALDFENENEATGETELPNIIMGRNPVKEAIKSGRSIDRILVIKEHDGSLGEIITLAREAKLVIREVERSKLDELCMPFGHNGKSGNHQGIVAEIPGVEYAELDDILEYADVRGEKPFIILLDGIEDPHNLGSIIRSAECAGAHGVVITKRRSASVTATVVKTSAGAAEHMRIARVPNLSNTINLLKEKNIWIAGADMSGKPMYDVDMKGGFALVIGSEGNGLSKLIKEQCDFLVSIPIKGHLDSLNAAVAGAIIMFEKNRQEQNN